VELKLYFQMLRRGLWLIVLTALVALSVSLVVSYFTEPVYTATASFIITPNPSLISGPDVIRGMDVLGNTSVVSTYAEVMNSNRIYIDTLELMQLTRQDVIDYTYLAVVFPNTSVVELSVSGPNPVVATELANAIGYQTVDFTRQLNQVFDIDFLDAAEPPKIPVTPQPLRDASLALILGLVGGAALVILREEIRIPVEAYRQRLRMDSATGVYNSKYFPRLLEEEISQNPDNLLSVGIIELNGMRDLLETLPTASLHLILQKVTDSLQKELRGNDMIGRWNEVSFIVMLPKTSSASANRIFERIFQALTIPIDMGNLGTMVNLDPHIGGAEYSNNITTTELIEKADDALVQARRGGANSVYIWSMKNPFWAQEETK